MADEDNPFIRYRRRLDSYAHAIARGWTDDQFVTEVRRLDERVAAVDGRTFRVTPLTEQPSLGSSLRIGGDLFVKDDTSNVSGSHKARHLFGVALELAVTSQTSGRLAIASCGNAALAAGVIAKAIDRPLRVFIPTWADPTVIRSLESLGADISVAHRRPNESGDPTYLRLVEAVEAGAQPFSVQGNITPSTIDGGRTMGWELADQLVERLVDGVVRVLVQIGGGALATATWEGLEQGLSTRDSIRPVLHAVQTEACAPLARAWERLTGTVSGQPWPDRAAAISGDPHTMRGLEEAMAVDPGRFMEVWAEVGSSAASGILDDYTYDWSQVVAGMMSSGGWPLVVTEQQVIDTCQATRRHTTIDADATGTSGLAGVLAPSLAQTLAAGDTVVALFTGSRRST